mmetsp:Transcript_12878/g.48159  ORF Transcript_12878/g.48159 Transcript_12878/m.48159 type:complete len:234 (+) Transcript_12878:210-911(+)
MIRRWRVRRCRLRRVPHAVRRRHESARGERVLDLPVLRGARVGRGARRRGLVRRSLLRCCCSRRVVLCDLRGFPRSLRHRRLQLIFLAPPALHPRRCFLQQLRRGHREAGVERGPAFDATGKLFEVRERVPRRLDVNRTRRAPPVHVVCPQKEIVLCAKPSQHVRLTRHVQRHRGLDFVVLREFRGEQRVVRFGVLHGHHLGHDVIPVLDGFRRGVDASPLRADRLQISHRRS